MIINESTFEITTSQYDYGVPVVFEAGTEQGFQLGDKIVFCFDTDAIGDKTFTVSRSDYAFELALAKEEADALFAKSLIYRVPIRYSAKRYVEGHFLETLVDSTLTVASTVKMEENNNG